MIGLLFFCAHMSIFLGMIVYVEVRRHWRFAVEEATAPFAHDSLIFPDYKYV
jgi:hypothetical protein